MVEHVLIARLTIHSVKFFSPRPPGGLSEQVSIFSTFRSGVLTRQLTFPILSVCSKSTDHATRDAMHNSSFLLFFLQKHFLGKKKGDTLVAFFT